MFNKKQGNERDTTSPPPTYTPEPTRPTYTPPTPTSATDATAPAATGTAAGTFLAEGTTFKGKADITGTMRIEGKADGNIDATESIVVGKTGVVQATLNTRRAVLNGRFQGKIEATDRVEMQTGSRIEADIHAKNMVMEDGVQFSGNCRVGQ